MTGISSAFDIAKQALTVNQYALSVTGQNIANAGTTGYSRQIVNLSSTGTVLLNGNAYGTGVDITSITRAYNDTVEDLLSDQQSALSAYEEMATDLTYIQEIFSLGTAGSLDTLISDFWSRWGDLSDVPDGTAERLAVLESAESVTAQFNAMGAQLTRLTDTVNNEIEAAVSSINTLTAKIAEVNESIVALEAQGMTANDLRDERTSLVSELSELIDISTFEQSNGALAVSTASGSAILVNAGGARGLSVSGGQVMWESTGGLVDITNRISGGSVSGWLDIREEVIPTFQAELDELANAFIWNVNYQHSQGVGLSYFSEPVTGSFGVGASGLMSTLAFADKVDATGGFTMWIENTSTDPATYTEVSMADVSAFSAVDYTLQDFADDLNTAITAAGGGVTVSVTDGQIVFTPASSDYQFAFGSDDEDYVDSGLAAALGINTFFTGTNAYTMGVNDLLSDTELIAAGKIDAETGEIAVGDGTNAHLLAECGEVDMEIPLWRFDRGGVAVSTSVTTSTDGYYETMVSYLGILVSSVESNAETAETLAASLQAQRDSISAVSLDEEVINLTKYQNAYAAASRLLTVADEMLDELLSIR